VKPEASADNSLTVKSITSRHHELTFPDIIIETFVNSLLGGICHQDVSLMIVDGGAGLLYADMVFLISALYVGSLCSEHRTIFEACAGREFIIYRPWHGADLYLIDCNCPTSHVPAKYVTWTLFHQVER
jgi:hypothetical protein